MALRRAPKVFNSTYRPPAPRKERGQYRSLRPLLGLVGVIILLLLLARLPIFTIKSVLVEGTTDAVVISELEKLKGRSVFSQFISSTVQQIRSNHVEIADLICKRGIPDTIRCQVSVREPSLIWRHNNQGWLVDSTGYIYAPAPESTTILTIEDRGPTAVTAGQTVISPELVAFYQQLLNGLQEDGYAVTSTYITESLFQLNVVTTGNNKPEIAWTPTKPITLMLVTSYSVESQRQALRQIVIDKKSSITERIDLRVPGYAYTK